MIGTDAGITSYNEAPRKRFILNGMTTVSTDFVKMGEMAAPMILYNEIKKMEVPLL